MVLDLGARAGRPRVEPLGLVWLAPREDDRPGTCARFPSRPAHRSLDADPEVRTTHWALTLADEPAKWGLVPELSFEDGGSGVPDRTLPDCTAAEIDRIGTPTLDRQRRDQDQSAGAGAGDPGPDPGATGRKGHDPIPTQDVFVVSG
jgi:hypothetical protein